MGYAFLRIKLSESTATLSSIRLEKCNGNGRISSSSSFYRERCLLIVADLGLEQKVWNWLNIGGADSCERLKGMQLVNMLVGVSMGVKV